MESSAKIDFEERCPPLALELGSNCSKTIPYMADDVNNGERSDKGHLSHYSDITVLTYDGEPAPMSTSHENDKRRMVPFTISLSSGVMESSLAVGPERTAASQLGSEKASMPENRLSNSLNASFEGCNARPAAGTGPFSIDALPPKDESCLQDTRPSQRATSAFAHRGELPLHISLASDGSSILQLATSAPDVPVPNVTSETEHRPLASDERIGFGKDKLRKRPRQLQQDAGTRDSNKSGEKQSVMRWKDVWVAQLIHIRGRMHSTFTGPQRQRVDLWQIVKHEMTNSCHGFDKDSEACRKKWIRVYKEYKDDRHLSNDEKAQKCRFYDLVDFYMGERANSFCNRPVCSEFRPMCPDAIHAAKDFMVTPLLPSNETEIKAVDDGAMAPQVSSDASLTKPITDSVSKQSPPAKKARFAENLMTQKQLLPPPLLREDPGLASTTSNRLPIKSSVQTMLSELVNIGKEMLQTTRDFEEEKLAVLHAIKDTLGKIAKRI